MDLCHWVNAYPELLNVILFTDEAYFTPYLTRKDTIMRDSLSVEERLALTLRFLTTGRAFEVMKFSVTISQAVIETCEAHKFSRIT